jgi:hypothetical protein
LYIFIHTYHSFLEDLSVITSRKVSHFAETIATKPDKFCQRMKSQGNVTLKRTQPSASASHPREPKVPPTSEHDHSPIPSIIIGRKESPDALQHEANPKNRNDDE